MKFIPMLFSTPMVQAILDSRKTQTRRIIKLRDGSLPECESISYEIEVDNQGEWKQGKPDKVMDFSKTFPYWQELKPKYKVGDVLWVRETWQQRSEDAIKMGFAKYYYKAGWEGCTEAGWKPNIHMPKTAARHFLKIKSITVEKLQDITEADAVAEGVEFLKDESKLFCGYRNYTDKSMRYSRAIDSFKSLWESINGIASLKANPFVWVIEFERIEKPINFC